MNAKIQYLACVCEDPDNVAEFYKKYLSFRQIGRTKEGDVALTDGHYNFSLLARTNADEELGFSHIGVAIDDVDEIGKRLREFYPDRVVATEEREEDVARGAFWIIDPNGMKISLSTNHFHVPNDSIVADAPRIRHVAISVKRNEEVLSFMKRVFDFRETTHSFKRRTDGSTPSRFAGDGDTALAILGYRGLPPDEGAGPADHGGPTDRKYGVQHFGILLKERDAVMDALPEGRVGKRPERLDMAEFRVADPEGNGFDLSRDKGFEVDYDVWVNYKN